MAKDSRPGKFLIVWGRNADFKTTIGVNSQRAKWYLPFVCAPVSWAEIETFQKKGELDSARFTPEDVTKRLKQNGDSFASLLTMRQRLPTVEGPEEKVATRKSKRNQKPAGTGVPKFVEPMLLLKTDSLPEGEEWLYEIKLDGYRALALKAGGRLSLRSRNDKDFKVRFPAIAQTLEALPDNTAIDGEVVALDEAGKPSFTLLQNYASSKAPLVFYAFDILMLEGRDVTQEPLNKRREILARMLQDHLAEPVRQSPELDASLPDLIRSVKAEGLEGLVAKRRDSRYEFGQRTGAWRKMRVNQGQELVIGGYTPSAKNFDALVVGYYENKKLIYAGRTRNGFTPLLRKELFRILEKLETETCPFSDLPEKGGGRWGQGLTATKMKACRWLKPMTVGQFEFVEWTPDDHLRHLKFIGLREDKKATAVVREG